MRLKLPVSFRKRKRSSHKGNFGHVFIIAGSRRFSGAAVLSAEAALRCGAGLVTLGIPESINSAVIKIKPIEVMTLPLPETAEGTLSASGYKKILDFIQSVDVVVIGPGLSRHASTQQLARKLIKAVTKPAIIDADGLNAAAACPGILAGKLITPHPGEMARLLGARGASFSAGHAQRKEVAKQFARYYNVTIVLKGHRSVVADGQGKVYLNTTGNPGMATAGSGDVLTGMIAALLGQGLDKFNAAKYAVYLHGLAGDLAAREKTEVSLIASDIIAYIPQAIKKSS
jgi:ADP-dependent NAD(P)H-hydrate dehydratase / NAD(P)H-hydrate epimerase